MKTWPLLGLAALMLVSCQGKTNFQQPTAHKPVNQQPTTQIDLLQAYQATFVNTIRATEDLPIAIMIKESGCIRFKSFEVQERTASTLKLLVKGDAVSAETPGTVCRTEDLYSVLTYTDPGKPARTSPFKIFVNSEFYGAVSVK